MTPEEKIQDALRRGMVRTGNRSDAYGVAGLNSEAAIESSRPGVESSMPTGRGVKSSAPQPVPVPRRAKADPGQTYFGRMLAGLEDGANAGYLVGSEPSVRGPFAPSPIQWIDGVEPTLGYSVEDVPDTLTEPYANTASAPNEAVACPYLEDGKCQLVSNEIGPCLCGGQS